MRVRAVLVRVRVRGYLVRILMIRRVGVIILRGIRLVAVVVVLVILGSLMGVGVPAAVV